jgi:UDP-N-acetyl-D-galactosamine dehydrogenase
MDIVKKLNEFGIDPIVVDPQADPAAVYREYGIKLAALDDISDADCLVFAVAHNEFKNLSANEVGSLFFAGSNAEKIVIDVKSILDKTAFERNGYRYWRL